MNENYLLDSETTESDTDSEYSQLIDKKEGKFEEKKIYEKRFSWVGTPLELLMFNLIKIYKFKRFKKSKIIDCIIDNQYYKQLKIPPNRSQILSTLNCRCALKESFFLEFERKKKKLVEEQKRIENDLKNDLIFGSIFKEMEKKDKGNKEEIYSKAKNEISVESHECVLKCEEILSDDYTDEIEEDMEKEEDKKNKPSLRDGYNNKEEENRKKSRINWNNPEYKELVLLLYNSYIIKFNFQKRFLRGRIKVLYQLLESHSIYKNLKDPPNMINIGFKLDHMNRYSKKKFKTKFMNLISINGIELQKSIEEYFKKSVFSMIYNVEDFIGEIEDKKNPGELKHKSDKIFNFTTKKIHLEEDIESIDINNNNTRTVKKFRYSWAESINEKNEKCFIYISEEGEAKYIITATIFESLLHFLKSIKRIFSCIKDIEEKIDNALKHFNVGNIFKPLTWAFNSKTNQIICIVSKFFINLYEIVYLLNYIN
jgi:hypothetical protein